MKDRVLTETLINPERTDWDSLLRRPKLDTDALDTSVRGVFRDVMKNGDKAVRKYTSLFDGIALSEIKVSRAEFLDAKRQVPDELKTAIKRAKRNIKRFHKSQQLKPKAVETEEGVTCWMESRAIEKIGLYVPGGTAPLFSTVLMLAVPAEIAGCDEIVMCTPPGEDGLIDPAILYTADLCGIKSVYKVGGMQAVAALTFGTESVPAVYKIFGPGNQYVTAAKQMALQYGVAIDMPAGPSELLVFADDSANASFVASDLLSQAEHGPDSQVLLVTTSEDFANRVKDEIEVQLKHLPRKAIAEQALEKSKFIVMNDSDSALELINAYGPEHLIITTENEDEIIDKIKNAGSVFIGTYTPESAGDYASGTNHTLPTNGFTKQYSGLNLNSFTKQISFQKITKTGLQKLGPSIEILASAEGLSAHKNAVTLRLKTLMTKE